MHCIKPVTTARFSKTEPSELSVSSARLAQVRVGPVGGPPITAEGPREFHFHDGPQPLFLFDPVTTTTLSIAP